MFVEGDSDILIPNDNNHVPSTRSVNNYLSTKSKSDHGAHLSSSVQNAGKQMRKTAESVAENIGVAVNNLQLNQRQKNLAIFAACSVLFFLLSLQLNSFRYDLISLIGGCVLCLACIKKDEFPSILLSLAISIFMLRFLMIDFQFTSGVIYYEITFFYVIQRLAMYAIAVLSWVFISQEPRISFMANRIFMGICAYLTLCALTDLVRGVSFSSFMFSLGEIMFYLTFTVLSFGLDTKISANQTDSIQKCSLPSPFGPHDAVHSNYVCAHCETNISDAASFCNICGTPVVRIFSPEIKEGNSDAVDEKNSISDPLYKTFCLNCGIYHALDQNYCNKCGSKLQQKAQPLHQPTYINNVADSPSFGIAVLGFFFPVIGLILYLIWKDDSPLRGKSAGKGALIGAIAWIAVYILAIVITNFYVISLFNALY